MYVRKAWNSAVQQVCNCAWHDVTYLNQHVKSQSHTVCLSLSLFLHSFSRTPWHPHLKRLLDAVCASEAER